MDSPYTSSSNIDVWRTGLEENSPPPNILFDLTPRDHGESNMTSLGLGPLELEQLPNFFSLPSCPPYKYGHIGDREYPPPKGPHDIADALLSLKHAVVHPDLRGPLSPLSPPPPPQSMSHFGTSHYSGQHMSNYSLPSPGPYSHGHYPHAHPSSQSLSYSMNHNPASMQNSYGAQTLGPPPPHHQYPQYDQCPSPTLQHPMQTANVHFPSMSVNVSMSMNVGMPANLNLGPPGPGQYNCGNNPGGGVSQNWSIPPPSPTLPPQNPAALSQYHTSATSSLQTHCNGYTGQSHAFSHFNPDYRSVPPDPRASVYYKPVPENFKESKFCQMNHHHHHHHEHVLKRSRFSADRSVPSAPGLDGSLVKTNLCRICGKTYARPSTLKTHLRTHSGEKPYKCSTCSKSFSQAANLTAHLRTHSGEKPFRCPVCERRFSQSSSVTTHMRTHSGERPYRCRMCKKAFSDSSTLTKHLRIHSGEKPYQCKLCLLRFSQSGNLNRHMRVHSSTS